MKRNRRPGLLLLGALVMACGPAQAPRGADVASAVNPPPPAESGLRYVIYYNSDATPFAALAATRYTHVIVSFLRAHITAEGRLALIEPPKMEGQWPAVETVRASGKRVLVSFGGGEVGAADYAPLAGRERELAAVIAGFVREHDLDGVDVDFEASEMFDLDRPAGVADGRAFLIALGKHLRAELPAPRYELTHAPQAPYLNPEWHGGPYLDVLHALPSAVDWITVQYYNNPGYDTPVADRIVGAERRAWSTSYRALTHPQGHLSWPPNRVLVGKPVYRRETGNGLLSPEQIRDEILAPLCAAFGPDFGGLAGWEFSDGTANHRDWNTRLPQALSSEACVAQ